MSTERVTFTADGLTLVGDPALMHERGVTTLAFDHRGFGESGGRRAHEDSQGFAGSTRGTRSSRFW